MVDPCLFLLNYLLFPPCGIDAFWISSCGSKISHFSHYAHWENELLIRYSTCILCLIGGWNLWLWAILYSTVTYATQYIIVDWYSICGHHGNGLYNESLWKMLWIYYVLQHQQSHYLAFDATWCIQYINKLINCHDNMIGLAVAMVSSTRYEKNMQRTFDKFLKFSHWYIRQSE